MDIWLVISGVVLAVVLALVIVVTVMILKKNKGETAERPNYRVFFIMGAVMLPMGIAEMLVFRLWDWPFVIPLPLVVIGLMFLAIGLGNRDKWGKR